MIIIDNIDGNIEKALKKLKRKWDNSKAIFELRDRQSYTKPSETKRLQKEKAVRNNLKELKNGLDFKKPKNIPRKYKKV